MILKAGLISRWSSLLTMALLLSCSGCCKRSLCTTCYQMRPTATLPSMSPPVQSVEPGSYYMDPGVAATSAVSAPGAPGVPELPRFAPSGPGAAHLPDRGLSEATTGVPRYQSVRPGLAFGGTPSLDGIDWLTDQAFRTVLNLAPKQPDIEKTQVERLGMQYIAYPVTASQLSLETLEAFNSHIDDASNRPLFVHDADGRLLGALWYLRRRINDAIDQAAALEEARAVGLTDDDLDLWQAIRRVLDSAQPTPGAAAI